MAKKKKRKLNLEILETIPERIVEWEEGGKEGNTVLLVPRFRKGFLSRWMQPRLKKPFTRITLDDIGTFVWERCNGKIKAMDICAEMEEKFGERVHPVKERATMFLTTMYNHEFIRCWQRVDSEPTN